jgi:hypothetical protein
MENDSVVEKADKVVCVQYTRPGYPLSLLFRPCFNDANVLFFQAIDIDWGLRSLNTCTVDVLVCLLVMSSLR